MYLGNFQRSDEDRARNESRCHICLEEKPLTREHVPPKSAFNNCTRLWDRLAFQEIGTSTRRVRLRGGFRVKTLCQRCNTSVCAPYARAYVDFVRHLVSSPRLFDSSGSARLIRVNADTLYLAKEIATMILAVESLDFAMYREDLREFVLNENRVIDPHLRVLAFLVPDVDTAGTIVRYHARIDTYAPGYYFAGGEISWFPFGFVYASHIGEGYEPDRLTDITHWFATSDVKARHDAYLRLYCRITAVDSIQCGLGHPRLRPQIDYVGDYHS